MNSRGRLSKVAHCQRNRPSSPGFVSNVVDIMIRTSIVQSIDISVNSSFFDRQADTCLESGTPRGDW